MDQLAIDDILARFVQDDLTLEDAEQAIEQLYKSGHDVLAPLLALLDDLDPQKGAIAAVLLAATGDPTVVSTLIARVQMPSLDDRVKIKLIAAIVQIDPGVDPVDLLSHLRDPHTALQLARREHLQFLKSPHDLALWLEDVESEMGPELRIQLIEGSIELGDPAAVPMLICLCYDADDDVALAAMDVVERFKDIRALRPLEELAAYHSQPRVRVEARKTADRLRIRAALSEQVVLEPIQPIHACYLTPVDGTGGQIAVVVRCSPDEAFTVISVAFDDQQGISLCSGVIDVEMDQLESVLQEYAAKSRVLVPVAHERCLDALNLAVETTWQAGRPPPASYLAWRKLIESEESLDAAHSLGGAIPLQRRQELLAHCDELLFQDEFRFWLFDPDEVQDLRVRYVASAGRTDGVLDRQALQELLCQGVHSIVTDGWRGLIESRLQRMAPLLRELYEEDEVWQWAVIAAEALAEGSALPLEEHPFLLGMVACSLENAMGIPVGWFDGR